MTHRPLIASFVLLILQAWALAAEAPVTPGSVLETLPSGKPRLPTTPPQVVFPVQPSPSQHDPRAKRFRVNAFDMSGNTVYRSRLLKTLLERYVDLELNLYDLNRAADTITAYYHDHGYTLARAIIPAQKVVNGIVKIEIVEGRFGQVIITGNQNYASNFLTERTELLKPGALVKTDRLENILLLLNDMPGLRAKVVMEPGAQFGTSDAEIQVKEKWVDGSIIVNNYGREETGLKKIEASCNINAPLGVGDQLALAGSLAEQKLLRYWKMGYSMPLNTAGTRFSVSSSRAVFDVSGALAALGINGEVITTEAVLSHPFVRSRADNQTLSLSAKNSHLKQSALGSVITDNTVKVLNATYQINSIHADTSVTNVSLGLSTNFHSGNHNPAQQKAVFARMELDVNHTAPLYEKWDMYLRGDIVHSKERLPDTEKFSLGGPNSVRGYRPSEVRGDMGYLVQAELRHPFSLNNTVGVFRLTADAGEVTYKMPGYSDSRDRLRSVGFGATLYPYKGVSASFDIAAPARANHVASDSKKDVRLWVNLSASF